MCYFQEKMEILNFCYGITGSHRNVCEDFFSVFSLKNMGGTIDNWLLFGGNFTTF